VAWVGKTVGPFAVVGEEQQTFGVVVEAADGENPHPKALEKVGHDGAPFGVLQGGDIPHRLIEKNVHALLVNGDRFAVDGNGVPGGVGLGAQLGDRRTVHRDAPVGDHPLGLPAGCDSGLGEYLLQPFFHSCLSKKAKGQGRRT